ncbi:MAG TPA: hypothetical protein VFQ58_05810 [Flavisolibacter sp.]|jgi:hypothetical protein|nr:hypothetical protein [Flavisolibacter sp.]
MKAKIIHIDAHLGASKNSSSTNLKKSKINSLVKKIKEIYKEKEIKGYFNYPGFNRG